MNIVTSIVQVLVLMLVVAPLLAWITRRAKSEPKAESLERFRVQAPLAYRKVFLVCAIVFEAVFAAVAFISADDGAVCNPSFLWLGTTCALACLGFWLICTLEFAEIDGEAITCRNKVGRTSKFKVGDITRVTRSNSGALRLYVGSRCIARLSGDYTNVEALAERLKVEDITVDPHKQAPLTAFVLYREAISIFVGISVGLSLFVLLLFGSLVLAGTFPWWSLAFALVACVDIFIAVVGLGSLLPARGLIQLKRQERTLGFSFADEMAKREARGVRFCDEEWFVRIGACSIVAFRRDYVKNISTARQGSGGWECKLVDYKRGKHTVRADQETLKALRTWASGSLSASCHGTRVMGRVSLGRRF